MCHFVFFFNKQNKTKINLAADKFIKIWIAVSGDFKCNLEGHEEGILFNCLNFFLFFQKCFKINVKNLGISDISWSSDSALLCSASDDLTIKIWDIKEV